MLKFTKHSIPLVIVALVLTGRTEEAGSASRQPSGGPATSQQETRSEAAQRQIQQQEQQRQQQQQRQQRAQEEQQKQIAEQQKTQQSVFQPGRISDQQLKKQVTEVNKASSFIGMAVKNTNNEDLGKVNDLVFDPEKARISYAVLSVGGILGVGDKLIAVPITSLKPQPGQQHLVLNMQKSQLEAAPGIAQNNWPDLDSPGIGGAPSSETDSSSEASQPGNSSTDSSSSRPSASPSTTSSPDQSSSSNSDPSKSSKDTSGQGISAASDNTKTDSSSQAESPSDPSSINSESSSTQGESKKSDQ